MNAPARVNTPNRNPAAACADRDGAREADAKGAEKTKSNAYLNNMLQKLQSKRSGGFTLVEIMIVVAIIALLAAIAVPNFLRARKRSQATRILEDLREIDHAVDQYAIETGKATGAPVAFDDIKNYLKAGTNLYTTGKDIFGDDYGTFTVDTTPVVPDAAFNTLSDVADNTFWSPYK